MNESESKKDNELVINFLAGNKKSFELLLKKDFKPVFNFLLQITKDKAIAEDLTQETFIKVWKNIRRFDPEKKFKTWLFTIAKNTAFDYFKKKKTIPFSNFIDDEGNNRIENITEETILPDEILNRQESIENFEKILSKLPDHYQIILKMRYKEDFSLREISEILNKPYNTIKSSHRRALLALKKIIIKD